MSNNDHAPPGGPNSSPQGPDDQKPAFARGGQFGIELPIPAIRITLLGATGVGKTRFIDAFINNSFAYSEIEWDMPSTTQCDFYHRVLDLDAAPVGLELRGKRVTVELEDTPPAEFRRVREELELEAERALEVLEPTAHGDVPRAVHLEELQLRHPSARVIDMTRSEPVQLPEGLERLQPFSMFNYPRGFDERGYWRNRGMTQGRMGMFVMFDLLNEPSLKEAIEVFELIKKQSERRPELLTPLVYLIGNKDDLVGRPEDVSAVKRIRFEAERYATRQSIQFHCVSAKTGAKVLRVVKRMVSSLIEQPQLINLEMTRSRSGRRPPPGEAYGTPASSVEEDDEDPYATRAERRRAQREATTGARGDADN